MEFTDEVISRLTMSNRFTIANMAIEAGAKSGIMAADAITEKYVKERVLSGSQLKLFNSDNDAGYSDIKEYDASLIEPQVSFPHLPENARGISEVGNISIDQAVIGSCTNGRLEDLQIAAKVLKGKKVAPYVRLIIIPATPYIYREAMRQGLLKIFADEQIYSNKHQVALNLEKY